MSNYDRYCVRITYFVISPHTWMDGGYNCHYEHEIFPLSKLINNSHTVYKADEYATYIELSDSSKRLLEELYPYPLTEQDKGFEIIKAEILQNYKIELVMEPADTTTCEPPQRQRRAIGRVIRRRIAHIRRLIRRPII